MNVYQKPPSDVFCPDWHKAMSKVCPTCVMWTAISGRAASGTGEAQMGWVCAKAAVFQSNLEIANQLREMGAATESLRNKVAANTKVQAAALLSQRLEPPAAQLLSHSEAPQ